VRQRSGLAFAVGLVLSACGGTKDDPSGNTANEGSAGAPATSPDAGGSAASGDTWANFARTFFADYCVECHGAGDANRDYTLYEQVARDATEIRCGVASVQLPDCSGFPPPKQFPIGTGAHPEDPARDRLVAWIEAGFPEQ